MNAPIAPTAITLDNFQQILLEDSKHTFILVQFWVPESEACTQVTQMLSRLTPRYANVMQYTQVNCNEQQQIASQFGIKSLPTVMLVKDGQPVDGFAGMVDEAQIEALLAKHLPQPEDELLIQAQEKLNAGDVQGALPLAQQAYAISPDNIDCQYMLADCQIDVGHIVAAKALLENIGLVDQDNRYAVLQGKIELAEQAAESPELKALQAQYAANPEDKDIKVELAVALHAAHQTEEALGLLYSIVQIDLNFGDAKKYLLEMINALPDGEPLKSSYRRKVYSLLY
ncbi:MAG: tetratricopeptide repeat protein [Glaciecola sp.]|jgi:putative thioredoxin|nr:tetratricopeptide repeat protein [Glaciecola sp.]MDG1467690.1 tetratricopeptide repeat protein [Glaciecola sp.]MDG1922375.1 tetratricopeptide repeat protein [Glaciecola sp.]